MPPNFIGDGSGRFARAAAAAVFILLCRAILVRRDFLPCSQAYSSEGMSQLKKCDIARTRLAHVAAILMRSLQSM